MAQDRTKPARAETELRIGATMALPAVLRSLGADPAEVLAEAGVDLKLFDDPDNRISYAARGHLLAHCAARTGCPHLGLLVGQQAGLQSLGLVGLLVKYSSDVRTALRTLTRFLHLHVRGAVSSLEMEGNRAIFTYEVYHPGTDGTDQVGDGAVAAIFNIMKTLCGPIWKPSEVRFAHRKPDDVRPYRSFFKAPLVFDTKLNAVVFTADWLNQPVSRADPDLQQLLREQVNALELRFGDDLPGQVRSVLRSALLTDHAGSQQVAELFSMHSRTLRRRLNDCGTSFQELLDEGRFEIARQMLQDTGMEVSQISEALGYADASTFIRAFRRWSGSTPARWRTERLAKANRPD